MEFNKFIMYSYNAQINQANVLDEVDVYRQNLMRMTEYDDVRNYLVSKFGEFEGVKWVKFADLNKLVYLYLDEQKAEFCALKDNHKYWGKGWMLVEADE